jgi:hypothetical protein
MNTHLCHNVLQRYPFFYKCENPTVSGWVCSEYSNPSILYQYSQTDILALDQSCWKNLATFFPF